MPENKRGNEPPLPSIIGGKFKEHPILLYEPEKKD
jgi:hypothetical protein